MFIKQLYTGCLSEAAYYIEHNGEAAIIDPLRDVAGYLDLAGERRASIKYIFEWYRQFSQEISTKSILIPNSEG